jgi:hypothetical protein
MYPDPKKPVADTMPPPSCDDTQRQFRLDIDPDESTRDGQIIILDDDGDYD